MPRKRSYGEMFSTLTRNLRMSASSGKRNTLIHISEQPITEPFLEPFDELKKTIAELKTGAVKANPNHWKPLDKQSQELENLSTVAAY